MTEEEKLEGRKRKRERQGTAVGFRFAHPTYGTAVYCQTYSH